MSSGAPTTPRLQLGGREEFDAVAAEWDALALQARTPFLSHAWLGCWWDAFAPDDGSCLLTRDADGQLQAGAVMRTGRRGTRTAAANDHTGDWDVVAASADARAHLWAEIAGADASALRLMGLRAHSPEAGVAEGLLRDAGFRLVTREAPQSPFLPLPPTWDELLQSISRNLRSQWRRARRTLEAEGEVRVRTVRGGEELPGALEALLRVEGSGWKARQGTAIASTPRTRTLYWDFAERAAANGWLRIHLLELEGEAIAADLDCVYGGECYLVKTGFDERFASFSPGLLLRGEALRLAIEDGCRGYDFLGPPDGYKMRWASELRPRLHLYAYRGVARMPQLVYRSRVRPALAALRRRLGLPRPAALRRGS